MTRVVPQCTFPKQFIVHKSATKDFIRSGIQCNRAHACRGESPAFYPQQHACMHARTHTCVHTQT